MTLRIQDAVEHVKNNLQLGSPDAQLYVHLCVAGPAKVSDLAEALKLHRNDVYRTTERLVQRGLIQTTVERPARFVAVAPEQVFDSEINARLAAVEQLRKSRTEITALVDQLHSLSPTPSKGVYKIIQGRQAIYQQREHMIAGAERTVDWASSFPASVHHMAVTGALDAMLQRAAEGIRFRVLVTTTPDTRRRLAPFDEAGSEVRQFDVDVPVRFCIVDDRELLMFVVNDTSESLYAEDEVAIYSTAPGFVHAQRLFMEQSWAASQPLGALGE